MRNREQAICKKPQNIHRFPPLLTDQHLSRKTVKPATPYCSLMRERPEIPFKVSISNGMSTRRTDTLETLNWGMERP